MLQSTRNGTADRDACGSAMAGQAGGAGRGYRPCLLSWSKGEAPQSGVELTREIGLRCDAQLKLISVDRSTQLLLCAERPPHATTRRSFTRAVRELLESLRSRYPESEVRAVIGDRIGAGEGFADVVSRLRRSERLAPAEGIVSPRRCALAHLLEAVEPRRAGAFVEEQLETLAAYDHEHGTNLLRVLELALDHPDRNAAANAAFMHRNTFRRQLRTALEAADADIESPEERLALHLALKLRTLRAAGSAFEPAPPRPAVAGPPSARMARSPFGRS